MKREDRFDPYYANMKYSFLASEAAVEIDNSTRSNDSRLDKVRELGELLDTAVSQSSSNPDLGFYSIIEFRDGFQKPLEEFGYKMLKHTQEPLLRAELLQGISQAAEELRRFAYMPKEMQPRAENLMKFCCSLSRNLRSINDFGIRHLAA